MTTFATTTNSNRVVIAVQGEVDMSNANELAAELTAGVEGGNHALAVDLTRCDFIDSSGATALIRTYKALHQQSRDFTIVCPQTNVRVHKVLNLMGLPEVIEVADSLPNDLPASE